MVDYAFQYSPNKLVAYHYLIMNEMIARGYRPDKIWFDPHWRGSALGEDKDWCCQDIVDDIYECNGMIYDEHNDAYLKECIENLRAKDIDVTEMEKLL